MTYSLADFSRLTSAKELVSSRLLDKELPSIDEVKTLAKWSGELLDLFNLPKPDPSLPPEDRFDRSSALSRIAYCGAELGWADEQIMAAIMDADERWGKYTGRASRENILLNMVNRARQKIGYNPVEEITLAGMLGAKEKDFDTETSTKLVYGFKEFIEADFPINWMLEGLLPESGYGLFVAHPGVGKTRLALQLGACLALGEERFLQWPNIGGTKKVLFLSFEMNAASLHLFLSNMAPGYEDHNTLQRNLLLAPMGQPLPLDTEAGQKFMDNMLTEYQPDVVIIDSLQMISSESLTDEQASKSLMHYISSTRNHYKCAFVIIHHNRKKPNDAQKKGVEQSDVFGSTYLVAAADFVLNLHKVSKGLVTVTMFKVRLGQEPEPFDIYSSDHMKFTMDFDQLQRDISGVDLHVDTDMGALRGRG